MNKSPEIKNLAAALAKAQAEVGGVAFDSVNPHFKSKYASLSAYLDSMVNPFTKNGLSVSSSVEDGDKGIYLATLLLHSSGEWIEYRTPMILNKNDMQGLGSAETYSRRYRIAAIANVAADEDDDGNEASKNSPARTVSHTKASATSTPNKTTTKIGVTQDKQSPDEFILSGNLSGKKITDLDIGELEPWAKNAAEYIVKLGGDPAKTESPIARSYRAVKRRIAELQPSMFEAAPSGGLNS